MPDPRLHSEIARIKVGTCIMIPAGTKIFLCAQAGKGYGDPNLEAREVVLSTSWFVGVQDVEPVIRLEPPAEVR